MTETTRTADTTMSEEMKSLLAPTVDSASSWRDLFLLPMAALLLAMLIGALIMIATSVAPATILQSFIAMARGSLGSMHALSETVTAAIPLVLSGLGIGLAFRAGLFNIGAEGQMVVGGLATAVASFAITGLPIWIHLPLALVIGLSVGALYAAIAGILKAATGAHEVISTIMLNLISFRLLDYVLRQPVIQKEGRSDPISKAVLESAELPRLLAFIDGNLRLHAGLFIMLLAVALVYWLLFRSKLGFAFRISGENPGAARYAGIHAGLTVVLAWRLPARLPVAGATHQRRPRPRDSGFHRRHRVRRHRGGASRPLAPCRHSSCRAAVRRARGRRPADAGRCRRVDRSDRHHPGADHHLCRGAAAGAADLPAIVPRAWPEGA